MKRRIFSILLLISLIISLGCKGCTKEENVFSSIKSNDVEGIIIKLPSEESKNIKDKEGVFNIISSLKLKKLNLKDEEEPDGFVFLIEMKINGDKTYEMSCLSDKICIDNWYSVDDQEYVDKIRKIYEME